MAHRAEHLAAVGDDDGRGVALQRLAEGIVGDDEEPGFAAGLDDRLAGAVGQRWLLVGAGPRAARHRAVRRADRTGTAEAPVRPRPPVRLAAYLRPRADHPGAIPERVRLVRAALRRAA